MKSSIRLAEVVMRLRWRIWCPLLVMSLVAPYAAAVAAPSAAAGALDPDTVVYLQQVEPAIADAQTNLESLDYYLPLGSTNDLNDPTWSIAQQASDALRGDAGELETLSPPDSLSDPHAALTRTILDAAASSSAAISSLSSGDVGDGQLALATFHQQVQAFDRAQSELPAAPPDPLSQSIP